MAQEINLVQEIAEEEIKKGVYKKKLNLATLVFVGTVLAIMLLFFVYWLVLAGSASLINSRTRDAESRILQENRKEITRRALVTKLDEANKLLKTSSPYSLSITKLLTLLNNSKATLSESGITGSEFRLVGSVRNSSGFKRLADDLNSPEMTEVFADVALTSLSSSGASYDFVIEARFLPTGLLTELQGDQLPQ